MELKTDRLYIRSIQEGDWQELQGIFMDFRNSEYAVYDAPLPVDDKEVQELTKKFADSNLFFSVYLSEKSNMIGYVCFHKVDEKYDLGYCFHSKYQGNGYAFESIDTLIKYLQKQYHAKIFTAGTAVANTPSCNLLKKIGFKCQSTETLSFHKDSSGKDILFLGGNFVYKKY